MIGSMRADEVTRMRVPLSRVGVALGLVAIAVQNALIAWPGFVLLATQPGQVNLFDAAALVWHPACTIGFPVLAVLVLRRSNRVRMFVTRLLPQVAVIGVAIVIAVGSGVYFDVLAAIGVVLIAAVLALLWAPAASRRFFDSPAALTKAQLVRALIFPVVMLTFALLFRAAPH